MLRFICLDMHKRGIDTLYLLTDLSDFYEHCGWQYFCDATGDGEEKTSKMYMRR